MIYELYLLKSYVEQLLAVPVAYHPQTFLNELVVECERLKETFLSAYRKAANIEEVTDVLNRHRYAIVRLSDTLLDVSGKGHFMAFHALVLVTDLARHMENEYSCLLDKHHAMPVFEVRELDYEVSKELDTINKQLRTKGVSPMLITQLIKAHQDLFKPLRYPGLSYSDKQYLDVFLPQLKSLADDSRKKNWHMRLKQLLIRYNFNHMGVYNMLEEEQERSITALTDPEEKLDFFFNRRLWLQQLQEVPGFAYNTHAEDLKSLLLGHLKNQYSLLKEKLKIGKIINHEKFRRNLSVDELSLDFHYRYYQKEFGYGTKSEAAIAYTQNNTSKKATNISPHSIAKFDKVEQLKAAKNLYQRYQRILTRLAKDFDLKMW